MNLKRLGLSDYESRTYEAVVKLGKATASQISRESNVSYGKIYEVLASLEAKSLIKVLPEKTKAFVASDPEALLKLAKKQEQELNRVTEDIRHLKQLYEVREEEIVETVKGKRNFYKLIRKMPSPRKFKYTIKYASEFQPEWARQDGQLLKKGIDVKTLARHDDDTEKDVERWLAINPNIRHFMNEGVAIDIRDSEVLLSLITNNTAITIKNQAFADIMRRLFLSAYKDAPACHPSK